MFKSKRWNIVFLLSLGGAINYMDRSAFAIAAPMFASDLQLTPGELGIIFSSFSIGYALFNFVGGYASDRFGPKLVFAVSMAFWSFFCGLIGMAMGFASMLVIRVLFGAGEGPFAATLNKMVNNWFPRREIGSAIGVATAGNPLGGAVAGSIMGTLVLVIGWRMAFVAIALLGFVWLAFWIKIAKDRPEQHASITPEELALIQQGQQGDDEEIDESSLPLSFYIKQPTILATAFAFFGLNYILFFFLSWFPSYLSTSQHLSLKDMSIVSVIPWLLGSVGMALGGYLCDCLVRKTGNALLSRKVVLVICLGASAIFVICVGNVTSATSAVTLMACGIFFLYLSATTYWGILQDTVARKNMGAVGGVVHATANVAGILGPIVTGYIIQWTGAYNTAFFIAGGVAVLGAISVAIFVKPLRLKDTKYVSVIGHE
ncbi:MFS transporter [Pseudomonas lundensis]|uniref:MFS transporter n=1 Tax=Serratia proteamaculans TaxID=28151 RepID=UPI0029816EBA|nr:MFS transporter [Serratia proteamaculans]MDW5500201.1 MFS transporter [Serratia proteamaculans]MDW5505267.1 MFS transporter [Pseudomonas lundensis]